MSLYLRLQWAPMSFAQIVHPCVYVCLQAVIAPQTVRDSTDFYYL